MRPFYHQYKYKLRKWCVCVGDFLYIIVVAADCMHLLHSTKTTPGYLLKRKLLSQIEVGGVGVVIDPFSFYNVKIICSRYTTYLQQILLIDHCPHCILVSRATIQKHFINNLNPL